jgi:Protein of unknown function (DUF1295)
MIAADAQKYFTLRLKRSLITDGMYRFIRHPNYLGEIMIYGSFALMVWHWLPFVVLAWVWDGFFAVNLTIKEASMSRYPEWAEYKKRSWWLLPPDPVGDFSEIKAHVSSGEGMMSDEQFYMCRNRSIVVALTLLLAGCNNQQTPTHRLPAPEVTVSKPEQKEGVNWNEFTGRTAAGKLVNAPGQRLQFRYPL